MEGSGLILKIDRVCRENGFQQDLVFPVGSCILQLVAEFENLAVIPFLFFRIFLIKQFPHPVAVPQPRAEEGAEIGQFVCHPEDLHIFVVAVFQIQQ